MSDNTIFIDTGAWIALLSTNDQHHDAAVNFYKSLKHTIRRTTSNFIIAETYTWLRYKAGFKHAATFLSTINKAKDNESLRIILDDTHIHLSAEQLLKQYSDQKLSYVDALSIAMMKENQINLVFCFDHHFSLAGLERVPLL